MSFVRPWVSGAAFAVVVGVAYTARAVSVLLLPDATMALFSTWMHGVDLTLIKRSPSSGMTASAFVEGFITAIVGGFTAGAL